MSDALSHQSVEHTQELSLSSVIIAVFLTIILAMSNAYLALKLGILTSASIPAAILAMGILRLLKKPDVLANNAIQTAASAGEAVAGGIVYTIPALIIIHYWQGFDYWTNVFIAAIGGILGVFFSIPLRKLLVHDKKLPFPEGRAIAEVIQTAADRTGLKEIVWGGAVGAALELLQVGLKVMASTWQAWFFGLRSLWVVGMGFSATMLGAGYLVGLEMACSILLGAILAWGVALPIKSHGQFLTLAKEPAAQVGVLLWNQELRYLGIGAMLFAGIWTFIRLLRPLMNSIRASFRTVSTADATKVTPRTESDIPIPYLLAAMGIVGALLFIFFQWILPIAEIGLDNEYGPTVIFVAVMYVFGVGFLFSVISAYFSGMVGVSASPGSSVVIAGILFAAWLLLMAINQVLPLPLTEEQLKAAEAIVIVIGAMVTGIAAIANDNIQDLKVGYLVGATPWRQQVMLLLGVFVSALVIPPVMQILFDVYGIGGVVPREGMDPGQSLPAPTAAMLAAIANAVFRHTLPWNMMLAGALMIVGVLLLSRLFRLSRYFNLSILGIAIGMYLPLSSSLPLFFGGLIRAMVNRTLQKQTLEPNFKRARQQKGVMIACGLVAGSALMDVAVSIPFSLFHSADALSLTGPDWAPYGVILAFLSTIVLAIWIRYRVVKEDEA